MPSTDSPAILVARFLQANNYNETLSALLTEAGLPPDAGVVGPGDLTLEKVLEEKKIFDLSLNFQKVGVGEEGVKSWLVPAPRVSNPITTLPTSTNILHVSIEDIEDFPNEGQHSRVILASTADRRLNILSTESPNHSLYASHGHLHDSPILSCAVVSKRWLVSTSMSGQLVLSDMRNQQVLDQAKDHSKYVVKVAVHEDEAAPEDEGEAGSALIATAGWDAKVFVYRSKLPQERYPGDGGAKRTLGNPIASVSLKSNPECIQIISHPEASRPIFLVSIRDSTFLYYYGLPEEESSSDVRRPPPSLVLLGQQNLAPHSNAWVAFSPSAFAQCPSDPTLLAVATSSVPYMKILFVRILLSSSFSQTEGLAAPPPPPPPPPPLTQAAQTRDALRRADKEAAAILSHTSTLAPQTAYSTPQVCWRPDGSGVWVNGDDGFVRGVEARTGKVLQTLKEGHEAGSKIRCICAGTSTEGKEVMVSGGFDHRLITWKVDDDDDHNDDG
ncbi:MAG: hypothetical protein M1837_002833 [Sclerophora amabilis]|nr:MAG: hypothetical protein M1837_002833 [Sclerophora amabilis]